LWKSID